MLSVVFVGIDLSTKEMRERIGTIAREYSVELFKRLRQIAFGLICSGEIIARANIARSQLDRGLKFFDGAIVMLKLDFEPAQRDAWRGARRMVLPGVLEGLRVSSELKTRR